MKKRILTLLSAIVLALTLAVPAFAGIADGGTVYISSLNMNVTLPEGMYYATRDVQEGDEYLELLDMPRDEFVEAMEEIDEHLMGNIVSIRAGVDIWVSDDDYGLEFADMSLEELEDDLDSYIQGLNNAGTETYDEELVFANGLGYEAFSYDRQTDDGLYSDRWYVTLHNGMSYTIALTSYDGPLSDEDKETIAAIVDSVVFLDDAQDETPAWTAPAVEVTPKVMPWDTLEKTPGYVGESIVEPETGVCLTVPENWDVKDTQGGELLRLVYHYDRTAVMTLSSEELSGAEDKRGWIGERTGVDYRDVEYVTRNGKTCYRLERDAGGEAVTEIYVFEDDRVYIYALNRDAGDKFAPELDELVSSAAYPENEEQPADDAVSAETQEHLVVFGLSVLVLVLFAVPAILIRVKRKKEFGLFPAFCITMAYTYVLARIMGAVQTDRCEVPELIYAIGVIAAFLILMLRWEPGKAGDGEPWSSRRAQEKPESPSGRFATTYSAASEYSRADSRPAAAPPQKPARPRSRAIPMPDAQRPKPKPAPKPRPEPEDEDDFFDDGGDWLEDEFYDDEAFDDYDAD